MTSPSTALSFREYLAHDAIGLAGLVRSGDVSASELLAIALTRTRAINPEFNAVTTLLEAHAEAQIAAGLPDGPLRGVPFLLKDLFIDLAGTTTTSGSVFLRDTVARTDSLVAERYKNAGLVIFGRTHSSEFGNTATTESTLFGATRNPWNPQYSAGGSSGGTAAAVAAGVVPAANGSDAGGSIRTPAGFCGLFGLKPTRGRVPLGPTRFDGGGGVATVHALTRSVRDSAALLDAIAGPELGSPYAAPTQLRPFLQDAEQDPKPLRIALVSRSIHGESASPDCTAALLDAAQLCRALGHEVTDVAPAIDFELLVHSRGILAAAATLMGVRNAERARGRTANPGEFEESTRYQSAQGLKVTGEDVMRAREAMYIVHRQVAAFMQDHDILLSPTTAIDRFPLDTISANLPQAQAAPGRRQIDAYTALANFTGQPSMSVPLYWTADDFPVGVQFSGRFAEEATLFQLAGQLERARPWMNRLPASTLAANF